MGKSRIILPIEGMSCASCAATVQEALTSATGVASATVNYATAKAAVHYDDAETGVAGLIKTVRMAGYDCGQASVTFAVEQLHYAPSVASLEQSEEHTSELQSPCNLVCRLLLEKKKKNEKTRSQRTVQNSIRNYTMM